MNASDVVRPLRLARLIGKSEDPVKDFLLASSIAQGKNSASAKRKGRAVELEFIRRAADSDVIKQAAEEGWLRRNFVSGWKDAGNNIASFVKSPAGQIKKGLTHSNEGWIGKATTAPLIAFDAAGAVGMGKNPSKKNQGAINEAYGKDVGRYYKHIKNKQFLADRGRVLERVGRTLGNVAGFGLSHKVRGFIPGTATFLGASFAGGRLGRGLDRLAGLKKPDISTEERGAITTLDAEAKRLRAEAKAKAKANHMQKVAMSSEMAKDALLAAALGIINGTHNYVDMTHPEREGTTPHRALATASDIASALAGARVYGTQGTGEQLATMLPYLGASIGTTAAGFGLWGTQNYEKKPLTKELLRSFRNKGQLLSAEQIDEVLSGQKLT